MTTSPTGTTGPGGPLVIAAGQTVAAGRSWSVVVTLTPSCAATASASWTITSQVANTNGSLTGANVAGPSAPFGATATASNQTPSATVVSSSLRWSFLYSFSDQFASGALTYRVTGANCSGWEVSIRASPLVYSGSRTGATIPASNLLLTTIGSPVLVSGAGGSPSAVTSPGHLGAARTVLRAPSGTGTAIYQQELGVAVTLPGGSPIGSYGSTITVTTAAGP